MPLLCFAKYNGLKYSLRSLFLYILLSVLVVSASAGQSPARIPAKNGPAAKGARLHGEPGANRSQPAEKEDADAKKKDDSPDKKTVRADLLMLLTEAREEKHLGHWEKASSLYLQVMKASLGQLPGQNNVKPGEQSAEAVLKDPLICHRWDDSEPSLHDVKDYAGYAEFARNQYCFARSQINTWWWKWGAYFSPLRWCHAHLCFSESALVVLVALAVLIKFLKLRTVLPKWAKSHFASRATILSPTKLTDKAESELFAYALANARKEIVRLFHDPDLGAGTVTMRALPQTFVNLKIPSTLSRSIESLPSVKGVDIGLIVRLFTSIGRYFTWRMDSALAFSPGIKAEDGLPGAPPRMRAFVNVRWAWHVGASAEVDREVRDQYDVDGVAIAVVARLMKEEF